MIDEEIWIAAKECFPVGANVHGTVEKCLPFGFFVKLPGFPGGMAVVDAIAYLPHGVVVDPSLWPSPGQSIDVEVVYHVDRHRQIKLRVGGEEVD
ncbi:RNA-binding protein [Streptomyces cinnamoneus]|uniref:S1 motif domain-containing protein n=1 Tax=Streptomyces cinnamoneus TaxID=53446 RepID=A0A918TW79_STRCJ|nr:RNA-binding protein [Streptomyces cinnamoneus]GHC65560.1 hypothetical protein GCM10010507_49010 [Streptomyces cinnamoneus]